MAEEKYIIPNLKNGIRVLKFIAESDAGETMPVISRELAIPKTTTLRILRTLCSERFCVIQDGRYMIGMGLIQLGFRLAENLKIGEIARPYLERLAQKTDETAHLVVLAEHQGLILAVVESPNPVKTSSPVGTLADLHCSAAGKVLLAYLIDGRIDEFFGDRPFQARTSNTLQSLESLKEELKKVRRQGYALDDEEYHPNVRCLAAPVRDAGGQVIAAVGITGASHRFTRAKVKSYARHVLAGAASVSNAIGG